MTNCAWSQVCGISISDNLVDLVFYIFDTNRDGNLSSDEFLRVLQRRESNASQPRGAGDKGLFSCWFECTKKSSSSEIFIWFFFFFFSFLLQIANSSHQSLHGCNCLIGKKRKCFIVKGKWLFFSTSFPSLSCDELQPRTWLVIWLTDCMLQSWTHLFSKVHGLSTSNIGIILVTDNREVICSRKASGFQIPAFVSKIVNILI